MNQVPHASGATFDELMSVVRQLRDPIYGCPWDREQTHVSLIGDLIEEAYEVIEAIETGDIADLIEDDFIFMKSSRVLSKSKTIALIIY